MLAKTIVLLLIVAASWALLSFLAHRSIYYPLRDGWWEQKDRVGAEDVWIDTTDGVRLHGWWIEAPGNGLATLYLHGNGGNITHRSHRIPAVTAAGSSLLLLDYRGYGKSQGAPGEAGLLRDAQAGYEFLLNRGIPPERIVLYGESLGTAVAVSLAALRPPAGLVLEAPFTSARAVAARVLPILGPLLISGYDSLKKIAHIHVPLLVLHGDEDEVIAFEFGERLFAAANEPKFFWRVRGAGHNNIPEIAGPEYVERLRDFYAKLHPPLNTESGPR